MSEAAWRVTAPDCHVVRVFTDEDEAREAAASYAEAEGDAPVTVEAATEGDVEVQYDIARACLAEAARAYVAAVEAHDASLADGFAGRETGATLEAAEGDLIEMAAITGFALEQLDAQGERIAAEIAAAPVRNAGYVPPPDVRAR